MPNLIDLIASFPDDAPNKFVGNIDLLCLQLLGWVVRGRWEIVAGHIAAAWDVGGTTSWRSSRAAGPITRVIRVRVSRHFFLGFNQNVADVVGCNVDSVCYACNAQDSLMV